MKTEVTGTVFERNDFPHILIDKKGKYMSNSRIVYQNWIVDLGRDPLIQGFNNVSIEKPDEHLIEAVSLALQQLSSNEKEFIVQFYYMGKSYQEISDQTGRVIYKLEALHNRALKKLEAHLVSFVTKKYGIISKCNYNCPICDSEYSNEVNEIIANMNPEETWRPIMKILRNEFGIKIRSPQTLIGHTKYHTQT